MNLSFLSEIGAFFTNVGKELFTFLLPIVKSEAGQALDQLLPLALGIVTELASGQLSSSAKQQAALASLGTAAKAAGINAATSVLNTAIELAYQHLQATTPATSTQPAA